MEEETPGVALLRSFFEAFLEVSGTYMGLATNSMIYRAGEMVGEAFSFISPDELVEMFHDLGMGLSIERRGMQIFFTVENSIEARMHGRAYEPSCHMLRGFFTAYARALTRNPNLRGRETECISAGGDVCQFLISP